jgi:hypothetical protein
MVRPPSSLPPTNDTPLDVSLILGSFTHSPARIELFKLYLPQSQPPPAHPDEASFHPLPPIDHTFRSEQMHPPTVVSLLFVGIVLSPWLVLLGLVSSIIIRLQFLELQRPLSGMVFISKLRSSTPSTSWLSLPFSVLSKYCLFGIGLPSNLARCCCMGAFLESSRCLQGNRH